MNKQRRLKVREKRKAERARAKRNAEAAHARSPLPLRAPAERTTWDGSHETVPGHMTKLNWFDQQG